MTDSSEAGNQGVGLTSVLNGTASTFALNGGAFSGSVSTLPGGTYNIWGSYGGDSANALSTSIPVSITVAPKIVASSSRPSRLPEPWARRARP